MGGDQSLCWCTENTEMFSAIFLEGLIHEEQTFRFGHSEPLSLTQVQLLLLSLLYERRNPPIG